MLNPIIRIQTLPAVMQIGKSCNTSNRCVLTHFSGIKYEYTSFIELFLFHWTSFKQNADILVLSDKQLCSVCPRLHNGSKQTNGGLHDDYTFYSQSMVRSPGRHYYWEGKWTFDVKDLMPIIELWKRKKHPCSIKKNTFSLLDINMCVLCETTHDQNKSSKKIYWRVN